MMFPNKLTLGISSKCNEFWKVWRNFKDRNISVLVSNGGGVELEPAHPPVHHPLDACYCSVVDEPQMS